MAFRLTAVLGFSALLVIASAPASGEDETGNTRVQVNGRGWTATPVHWSDGRMSIIIVPDPATPAPGGPTIASPDADAPAVVNAYVLHERLDCALDGPLHPVDAMVTGSYPGWAGQLKCKGPT